MNLDYIIPVNWDNIRNDVKKINSELTIICDELNSHKKLSLYKIRYPYGAQIVNTGNFYVPLDADNLVPLTDIRIKAEYQKNLGYSNIPLTLVLHNTCEVYVEANKRVVPLNYLAAGDLFGVFESANLISGIYNYPVWSVSAGSRSVFMLPKISEFTSHRKLKKELGILADTPIGYNDHWQVFKEIAATDTRTNKWYCEILVFGIELFEENTKKEYLSKLQKYIFKTSWIQSKLLLNLEVFRLNWAYFALAIANKNIKSSIYLFDTLKHLGSIANGYGVAYMPLDNESALPLKYIQDVYLNIYQLKMAIPIIMISNKLTLENKYVYYSLSFPNAMESIGINTFKIKKVIQEQRQLITLLNILLKTTNKTNKLIPENIKFDFFHTDSDQFGEIKSSQLIGVQDKRFLYQVNSTTTNRIFPAHASFLNGCIRISLI